MTPVRLKVRPLRWERRALKLDQGAASTMTERSAWTVRRSCDASASELSLFPMRDASGHQSEQWVRRWRPDGGLARVPLRRARSQLRHQMAPFEVELAARHRDPAGGPGGSDLRGIETVASLDRFFVNGAQELGNEPCGLRLLPKPEELRMADIPGRFAPQHRLGEERFPPQGNQPPGIEMLRMETPESHPTTIAIAQSPGKSREPRVDTHRRAQGDAA